MKRFQVVVEEIAGSANDDCGNSLLGQQLRQARGIELVGVGSVVRKQHHHASRCLLRLGKAIAVVAGRNFVDAGYAVLGVKRGEAHGEHNKERRLG